jgi:hypothetical protein
MNGIAGYCDQFIKHFLKDFRIISFFNKGIIIILMSICYGFARQYNNFPAVRGI